MFSPIDTDHTAEAEKIHADALLLPLEAAGLVSETEVEAIRDILGPFQAVLHKQPTGEPFWEELQKQWGT
jgi:hypothetical protein